MRALTEEMRTDRSDGDIPRSGAEDLALNLAERNCLFPANYRVIVIKKCLEGLVERWLVANDVRNMGNDMVRAKQIPLITREY